MFAVIVYFVNLIIVLFGSFFFVSSNLMHDLPTAALSSDILIIIKMIGAIVQSLNITSSALLKEVGRKLVVFNLWIYHVIYSCNLNLILWINIVICIHPFFFQFSWWLLVKNLFLHSIFLAWGLTLQRILPRSCIPIIILRF